MDVERMAPGQSLFELNVDRGLACNELEHLQGFTDHLRTDTVTLKN
jgi:hypothetical protein